ncbi:MAG TPA: phosphomannomutase, partial [Roseimicrobium sp.]|nr:phosphomannomutase [Roseimicrobium sp.]
QKFDAIVSADGDSDRPLVSDETGKWLRGDVAGVLCARFLGADSVCTPVSCNTALELTGWFKNIRRTRIGSPFVVAAMNAATRAGGRVVVGYEANGGFLLNSPVELGGRVLGPLPTRDAVIVILSVLLLAKARVCSVSSLAASLPPRFTSSGLLKNFATEKSRALLDRFTTGAEAGDRSELERVFGADFGPVQAINRTDGIRVTFSSGEIVHLRPSGNAPEFRCYTEASDEQQAVAMTETAVSLVRRISA